MIKSKEQNDSYFQPLGSSGSSVSSVVVSSESDSSKKKKRKSAKIKVSSNSTKKNKDAKEPLGSSSSVSSVVSSVSNSPKKIKSKAAKKELPQTPANIKNNGSAEEIIVKQKTPEPQDLSCISMEIPPTPGNHTHYYIKRIKTLEMEITSLQDLNIHWQKVVIEKTKRISELEKKISAKQPELLMTYQDSIMGDYKFDKMVKFIDFF